MTCYLCVGEFIEVSKEQQQNCYYCHVDKNVDYICSLNSHHFFCEECRLASPQELIRKVSQRGVSNIIEEIVSILKHPSMHLYGPYHHLLTATLYYSYLQTTFKIKKDLNKQLEKIEQKIEKYGIGSCGREGICGAVAGVGIAVATFLQSNEMKTKERNIVLQITGKSLMEIGSTPFPRCCKFSVYTSVLVAQDILSQHLTDNLLPPLTLPFCNFTENCPYHDQCSFNGD